MLIKEHVLKSWKPRPVVWVERWHPTRYLSPCGCYAQLAMPREDLALNSQNNRDLFFKVGNDIMVVKLLGD